MIFSVTYNLDDLPLLASNIINLANNERIWVFEGEIGAGKTTLIKAIAASMGVKGNVQSPTFSIVNEYLTDTEDTIYHFDFYRLKHPTEALDFGIEEYFDSGNFCFIEWAEKIEYLLPKNHLLIKIEPVGNKRKLAVMLKSEIKNNPNKI